MQILSNSLAPPGAEIARTIGAEKNPPAEADSFKSVMRNEGSKSTGPSSVQKEQARQIGKPQRRGSQPKPTERPVESSAKDDRDLNSNEAEAEEVKKPELRGSKAKSTNGKNGAIQKFMDSLESELGISADRLTAVLAQLPPEVKALPVEESAGVIIEKLGVPIEQQPAVTEAYVNLLGKSGLTDVQIGSKSDIRDSYGPFGANGFFDRGLAVKAEEQVGIETTSALTPRQKLNVTIDELNRRFFDVAPKVVDTSQTSLVKEPLALEDIKKSSLNQTTDIANDLGGKFPQNLHQPVLIENPLGNKNSMDLKASAGINSAESSIDSDLESIFSLADIEDYSVPIPNSKDIEAVSIGADSGLNGPGGKVKTWSVEELPFLAKGNLGADELMPRGLSRNESDKGLEVGKHGLNSDLSSESQDEIEATDSFANQFSIYGDKDRNGQVEGNQLNRLTPSTNHQLTSNERAANIEKMTSATQGLASKGGGEVKVVLSPEGLGSVQLKVKLHEGRLQVELKAENRESQKILEQSLNSLRENLSAHRLSVDSVKVDVGGDFTRQESSAQQNFSQPQFDMGREQARQFMNMFREENLAQRQGAFEPPGFKTYRSRKEESLAPVSQEIRPRGSLSASKGREINLVA